MSSAVLAKFSAGKGDSSARSAPLMSSSFSERDAVFPSTSGYCSAVAPPLLWVSLSDSYSALLLPSLSVAATEILLNPASFVLQIERNSLLLRSEKILTLCSAGCEALGSLCSSLIASLTIATVIRESSLF